MADYKNLIIPRSYNEYVQRVELQEVQTEITENIESVQTELQTQITTNAECIAQNTSDIESHTETLATHATTLANKQDTLTAGYNISLTNGVISCDIQTMSFKGSVNDSDDLPTQNNVIGDVWNVTSETQNYCWNGTTWIVIGSSIDLTNYYTKTEAQNALIPLHFVYVQFPGMPAPTTLYNFGTWTERTSSFAGAFFRAAGGGASAFGSGRQGARLPNIRGKIDGSAMNASGQFLTDADNLTITGAFSTHRSSRYSIYNGSTTGNYVDTLEFNANKANSIYTDNGEVRPENYTIRIWERTA